MEELKKEFEQLFTKDVTEITSIPKRRLAGNPQELWLWILNNFNVKVSQMQLPVKPANADLAKIVEQVTTEYLLDIKNCEYINSFNFTDKLNFANLIFQVARVEILKRLSV